MCGLASEFVRSSDLWAYGKMLVLVNSIVLQLEWFANSCACHRHAAKVIFLFLLYRTRRKHMNYFHDSSIGADCPVRGCVGPELAAGDFMAAFQRFREIASAEVLRLVADVSPQSRLKILCDFERGHQHLQYVFALKLGSLSGASQPL